MATGHSCASPVPTQSHFPLPFVLCLELQSHTCPCCFSDLPSTRVPVPSDIPTACFLTSLELSASVSLRGAFPDYSIILFLLFHHSAFFFFHSTHCYHYSMCLLCPHSSSPLPLFVCLFCFCLGGLFCFALFCFVS